MKTRVKITIPKPEAMRGFGKSQQFADGMTQAGYVYAADMKRRFNIFSRGGGDWAPLALSTVMARRGKKIGKQDRLALTGKLKPRRGRENSPQERLRMRLMTRLAVLKHKKIMLARNTRKGGSLVMAGKNYSILQDKDRSLIRALEVGAPGNVLELRGNTLTYGIRGGTKQGAKITVGKLAAIHHNGTATIPARRILDLPSTEAAARIQAVQAAAVRKFIAAQRKRG